MLHSSVAEVLKVTSVNRLICLAVVLALPIFSNAALAQWDLDSEKSAINFISIKNNTVAETHSFSSLVGMIGADGKVRVGVDLDSVQTKIGIRDERMREKLFETSKFPAATITAQLTPEMLADLSAGRTVAVDVPLSVDLHGQQQTLTAPLTAIVGSEGSLRVFSSRPIVVNAQEFGLVAGIEALQKIAGLNSISTAVPVTLHLLFTRSQ
jgi:polyisoprenoid-binding protein YceI